MVMRHRPHYTVLVAGMWLLAMRGVAAPQTVAIDFQSSADGSTRDGLLQLPTGYDEATSRPLLIWVQGMYTDARFGLDYIGETADRKEWLVAASDLRGERTGGATHLGAPIAQRDLIDMMDRIETLYPVDDRRVYLVGISMGGLTAGLTAENFPGRFAAVGLLMAITDLAAWRQESKPYPGINPDIDRECGGDPSVAPEEYARRTLFPAVATLASHPLFVNHGRGDGTVSPAQSEKLIEALLEFKPNHLYVNWFDGDHSQEKIELDRLAEFLGRFALPESADARAAGSQLWD